MKHACVSLRRRSITDDLLELTQSPGLTRASQTTWVYSDMYNSNDYDDGRGVSEIELYDATGATRADDGGSCADDETWTDPERPWETCEDWSGYSCDDEDIVIAACPRTCGMCPKFTGSRYITYDHALSKLIVTERLDGEQNSDTGTVLEEFLTTAFADCVSKGSDEFMLVFSAHGGGYTGFGGDDNVGRRRRLSNSNIDIANAIDDALVAASVPGIKLDVLGFDACLMCSYAALAEYQYLTTYYMASEVSVDTHPCPVFSPPFFLRLHFFFFLLSHCLLSGPHTCMPPPPAAVTHTLTVAGS